MTKMKGVMRASILITTPMTSIDRKSAMNAVFMIEPVRASAPGDSLRYRLRFVNRSPNDRCCWTRQTSLNAPSTFCISEMTV